MIDFLKSFLVGLATISIIPSVFVFYSYFPMVTVRILGGFFGLIMLIFVVLKIAEFGDDLRGKERLD